jgi:cyclopropane fatty-acyl-phospholipid synthase-like methyltransferase
MPIEGDFSKVSELRWLRSVNDYYIQTDFDYRRVWHRGDTLAYHFGYYNDGVHEHEHALANANQVLAEIACVRSGDRILDAGCGLGGSSFWLATKRSAQVVGITPVTQHVYAARKKAHDLSLSDRVSFHEADYAYTAFPNASFDVIWALESVCHAQSKEAFYREAARLLRPGGRIVVAEYIRTSRHLVPTLDFQMREWLDGWCIPDIDTADEHVAAATGAGFSGVRLTDYTGTTNRSLRRLYKLACIARPIDQVLYSLGLRSKAQHGNVIASLRQYQLLQRGAWFYGILSGNL